MFMPLELKNNFGAHSAGGELAFKLMSKCKNWLIYQTAQEMLKRHLNMVLGNQL